MHCFLTTDIEVVKELIIYIRYVKAGSSHTEFVKIVPLLDGTALSIASAVTTLLADLNLPLAKLCALGSDCAAVMVDRKNGVAANLKEHVPHIITNHCAAHRLALAAAQSTKDIPYLKKFKDILDQLFRFYQNSAVRMTGLHEVQKIMEEPKMKLQQAKDVRWLSHDNATRAFHRRLPSVLTSLEREAEERNDAQAHGREILHTYTTVGPMVAGTVALLRQMKTTPGSNFTSLDAYVEGLTSKGLNIRTTPNEQRDVIYQKFIDNLTQNLKDRFTDLPVLSCFSVFNLASLPEYPEELQSFGNDDLQTLSSHLHLDTDMVEQEWLGLKAMIITDEELRTKNASGVIEHLCEKLGEPYPNLVKICTVGLLIHQLLNVNEGSQH